MPSGVSHDANRERPAAEAEAVQLAVAEERARIGREVHDGPLQSLTAIGMHLAVVSQLVSGSASPEASQILDESRRLLSDELRELRHLVLELREEAEVPVDETPLADQVAILADRLRRVWGLQTQVDVRVTRELPVPMAREVRRILQESLSNAARHGGVTRAEVHLTDASGRLHIRVVQVGAGFPFLGTLEHEDLVQSRRGPVSLKARVRELDGRMRIISASDFAELQVDLPIEAR